MTVYSLYPGPDDIRILATYGCPDGVVSSVVTSVDDAEFADLLTDTLNEISACATVPVSVWDRRRPGFHEYPATHLRALTDRDARADLLAGAHSLWYERVKVLLHRALVDLDHLLARTSEPVRTAIAAELRTEVRALRAELDYMNGIATPDHAKRRYWRRESPLVDHGRLDDLNPSTRESLDRAERGASAERLEAGVVDMRLLDEVRWE